MEQLDVGRVTLAVERSGRGEPVLLIHGALIADAFRPLFFEPALTHSYQLVTYRRRGYEGSGLASGKISVAEQAADCKSLIEHLGFPKVHLVGHSFGGAVALQLAMDSPRLVHSLALLEPALMVGGSGQPYRNSIQSGLDSYRSEGAEAAVPAMLDARWPGFQAGLENAVPGALRQAVRDAGASFESELPALLEWQFGEAEAKLISPPVLSVLGEKSGKLSPRFEETHSWLLSSVKQAEGYVLPGAHHFLQIENPEGMAKALADFFGRHRMNAN
jgi:pimeloyl-ACP methyl ester carboxylesterase